MINEESILLEDLLESLISYQAIVILTRLLHTLLINLGEKLGKWLAIFPTMYLSGGACVLYIITGGGTMKIFFHSILCGNNLKCTTSTFNGAECFLAFVCIAIFMAQFLPNLNSLASVTLVGSITALVYCSLLWILSLTKGRPNDGVETEAMLITGKPSRVRDAFLGLEMLLLSFRGHNLVLEIQVSSMKRCLHLLMHIY